MSRSRGIRIQEKQIAAFRKWLNQNGAEILPATNKYELIRFKCQYGTGVLYQKENGNCSFSGPVVEEAFDCYKNAKPWVGTTKTKRVKKPKGIELNLLNRDGCNCFYCGEEMPDGDRTIEHLVNLTHGGTNRLSNKVLAHLLCNQKADCMTLVEKIKLRDELRYSNAN